MREQPIAEEAEGGETLLKSAAKTCDWSGLDELGQKIGRGLRAMLRDQGAEMPRVAYEGHEQMAFADWAGAHDGFEALARMKLSPLKGSLGISWPGATIAQLVDLHYGGDGRVRKAKAEFSAAETRFIEKLMARLSDQLSLCWREIEGAEASFVGLEPAPARLRVARGDEQVLVQSWHIGAGNLTDAKITMVLPVEGLRKLAPALGVEEALGDNVDESWRQQLRSAAMDVSLPVRTIFARPELAFDKLMNLAPGDVIPICLPRRVPVTVSGMLFAYGSIGESDGRSAIRVESIEKRYAEYE